jgi:hypothetical protein
MTVTIPHSLGTGVSRDWSCIEPLYLYRKERLFGRNSTKELGCPEIGGIVAGGDKK